MSFVYLAEARRGSAEEEVDLASTEFGGFAEEDEGEKKRGSCDWGREGVAEEGGGGRERKEGWGERLLKLERLSVRRKEEVQNAGRGGRREEGAGSCRRGVRGRKSKGGGREVAKAGNMSVEGKKKGRGRRE